MLSNDKILKIISMTDHTLLSPAATQFDVAELCNEAEKFGAASVCVPPCFVEFASNYSTNIDVCTVIGFPNGYNTRNTKILESLDAIRCGATELDMVINIGMLKSGNYEGVLEEINAVKEICEYRILKVIIEACLLTQDEKIKMCQIISESNADFVKTSTGFSLSGASQSDVALFKKHLTNGKKIKAAGGIKTFEQADQFIELGADRIGSSSLLKIAGEKL